MGGTTAGGMAPAFQTPPDLVRLARYLDPHRLSGNCLGRVQGHVEEDTLEEGGISEDEEAGRHSWPLDTPVGAGRVMVDRPPQHSGAVGDLEGRRATSSASLPPARNSLRRSRTSSASWWASRRTSTA